MHAASAVHRPTLEVLPPVADDSAAAALDGDPIFTPAEVALWLRTSTDQLRKWRDAGEGPAFLDLDRGLTRYRLSDLTAWVSTTRRLKALPASAKPQRGHVYGSRGEALCAA